MFRCRSKLRCRRIPQRPTSQRLAAIALFTLMILTGACSAGATEKVHVFSARPPVFVEIDLRSSPEIATLSEQERQALVQTHARRVRIAINANPDHLVALRVRGAPFAFDVMGEARQNNYMRALGAGYAATRRQHESTMASFLHLILESVKETHSDAALSIFGLPLEPGPIDDDTTRSANRRYAIAIDAVDAIVSSRSFVLIGTDETEWDRVQSGLREALRLRAERAIEFRTNQAWRIVFGEGVRDRTSSNDPGVEQHSSVLSREIDRHYDPTILAGRMREDRSRSALHQKPLPAPLEWTPNRTPGVWSANGGRTWRPENPFGLRAGMWRDAEHYRSWLRAEYARAAAMYEPLGGRVRIIHHQPAGWNTEDIDDDGVSDFTMSGALVTQATMNGTMPNGTELYPWRWDIFREELAAFLDEFPNATVGVYMSGDVPRTLESMHHSVAWPTEDYDHENERHQRIMIDEVIAPLVDIGVTEFWFDHTSEPDEVDDAVALMEAIRARWGVAGGMEAYPRDESKELRQDILSRVPAVAMHRFNKTRGRDATWEFPPADESEMLVVLKGYRSGDTIPPPTLEDAVAYAARGQIVMSGKADYDEWVLQVHGH